MPTMPPVVIDLVDVNSPSNHLTKEKDEGSLYSQWCVHRLSSFFDRMRIIDIRSALKYHKGNIIAAYSSISLAYENAILKEQKRPLNEEFKTLRKEKWMPYTGLKLMKTRRSFPVDMPGSICPLFERDWHIIQDEILTKSSLKQTETEINTIECGCCCTDAPFEQMVQCADGHLFCFMCLRRRVEESTFGGLPACGPLSCLDMEGCNQSIPWSEIKRAITSELLLKFEERQASDCVARASLPGLVYCPLCNFACEVDEGMSILKCPSCYKETCIKCKEPSHIPLRCDQVEKPNDTSLRNKIEEIMTKSVLRQCPSCKSELLKDGGCNKVTCRCGKSICYICRKPITDYRHFCEHVRDPGKKCNACNKCSLWEQEDMNAIVKNAKRQALEQHAVEDAGILEREIGPSDGFFAKRRRKT